MKRYRILAVMFAIVLATFTFMPRQTGALANPFFSDVSQNHPDFEAITYLKIHNIVSGYADGTFKPGQVVQRDEALRMIFSAFNPQLPEIKELPPFSDIKVLDWNYVYIQDAYSLGIVNGYSDGTFRPAQQVTLNENAKMALNTAQLGYGSLLQFSNTQTVINAPFNDVPASRWDAVYLQYLKGKNMLQGDANNNVSPLQGLTRAKLAEMIYQILMYIQKNSKVVEVTIENNVYSPAEITISPGMTVHWTNKDDVTHTVTSEGAELKVLDSPDLSKLLIPGGPTYEMFFNTSGTYQYTCKYHPGMHGKVTVMQVMP